jgi:hypothetical protein
MMTPPHISPSNYPHQPPENPAGGRFDPMNSLQQPFENLTRGMAVKGIDSALSSPKTGDGAPLRWGQDSIVVSTFPNP